MGNIESNEQIGWAVEKYVAEKVNGDVSPAKQFPFDIRNHESVFEVKSCFAHVKRKRLDKGGNQEHYLGRFLICCGSHQRFFEEATAMGLKPFYYFVLKDRDESAAWVPIGEKMLSWLEVDQLLKLKCRLFHRYDCVDFYVLKYTELFDREPKKQPTIKALSNSSEVSLG